ncbi:MAG TPA: OAM dimerization domain-containing protein [Candidatus Limnocylindrales bacterium]|nr:OAM dimerization domain-containing protein [Candidatus Limnocylindrales bacterium]
MGLDFTEVRAYGDTINDGAMQLSFTLPVPSGDEAREAARQLALKMGLDAPVVTEMADLGVDCTFFVLYGKCKHTVDFTAINIPKQQQKVMSFKEVNALIKDEIGRKLVVVAACTGSDAHTVGIDAIVNMKGYAGEYGLERYPEIEAYNLGSQVPNAVLLTRAVELSADAILVSQVVTQKNIHLENLTELVELAEAEGIRDKVLLVCGGPRISHELAIELGFDAGFGRGTMPNHVASFIAAELVRRKKMKDR